MVTRDFIQVDTGEAFFPVIERPISWTDSNGYSHKMDTHKAIVDVEKDRCLSIVSKDYHVITNENALDFLQKLIPLVFIGKTIEEFKCYNVLMPSTRSSCRMDFVIPYSENLFFDSKNDTYVPFIRLTNSYNRTFSLSCDFGFCRAICKNGMIYENKSVNFKMYHTERLNDNKLEEYANMARDKFGDIGGIWKSFAQQLEILKETKVSRSTVLPMFCRAFDHEVKEGDKYKGQKLTQVINRGEELENKANEYFDELGENSYALFNILTDYASYPISTNVSNVHIHSYQKRVGVWMNDLTLESQKKDFSIQSFIGERAMRSAQNWRKIIDDKGNERERRLTYNSDLSNFY